MVKDRSVKSILDRSPDYFDAMVPYCTPGGLPYFGSCEVTVPIMVEKDGLGLRVFHQLEWDILFGVSVPPDHESFETMGPAFNGLDKMVASCFSLWI